MDSVKSMGNRTGSHTVDPASLRGQLGGVQTLPAVMGSTLAERARRELPTTGETTRKRTAQPARTPPGPASGPLTAQEAQVARLAREGLSNPETGVRLFISSRAVQYHLSKEFTKLGISSRRQLQRVLSVDLDTLPRR